MLDNLNALGVLQIGDPAPRHGHWDRPPPVIQGRSRQPGRCAFESISVSVVSLDRLGKSFVAHLVFVPHALPINNYSRQRYSEAADVRARPSDNSRRCRSSVNRRQGSVRPLLRCLPSTCKTPLFLSGRCWIRTSAFLLVREKKSVAGVCRGLQNPHT